MRDRNEETIYYVIRNANYGEEGGYLEYVDLNRKKDKAVDFGFNDENPAESVFFLIKEKIIRVFRDINDAKTVAKLLEESPLPEEPLDLRIVKVTVSPNFRSEEVIYMTSKKKAKKVDDQKAVVAFASFNDSLLGERLVIRKGNKIIGSQG